MVAIVFAFGENLAVSLAQEIRWKKFTYGSRLSQREITERKEVGIRRATNKTRTKTKNVENRTRPTPKSRGRFE